MGSVSRGVEGQLLAGVSLHLYSCQDMRQNKWILILTRRPSTWRCMSYCVFGSAYPGGVLCSSVGGPLAVQAGRAEGWSQGPAESVGPHNAASQGVDHVLQSDGWTCLQPHGPDQERDHRKITQRRHTMFQTKYELVFSF